MASKVRDITGNKYARLKVLSFSHMEGCNSIWLCVCDCGNQKLVSKASLKRESTKSCGCLLREQCKKFRKHGHGSGLNGLRSKTYESWSTAKSRCYNPHDIGYKRYGALGVVMCEEWKNDFRAFLNDMGERPEGKTLDRINPFGDYEPGNCKWSTRKEQANNRKIHWLKAMKEQVDKSKVTR